jgi:hypothetical protein
MFKQKLDYIHYNPVLAGLCKVPEEYNIGKMILGLRIDIGDVGLKPTLKTPTSAFLWV